MEMIIELKSSKAQFFMPGYGYQTKLQLRSPVRFRRDEIENVLVELLNDCQAAPINASDPKVYCRQLTDALDDFVEEAADALVSSPRYNFHSEGVMSGYIIVS